MESRNCRICRVYLETTVIQIPNKIHISEKVAKILKMNVQRINQFYFKRFNIV